MATTKTILLLAIVAFAIVTKYKSEAAPQLFSFGQGTSQGTSNGIGSGIGQLAVFFSQELFSSIRNIFGLKPVVRDGLIISLSPTS